VSFKGSSNAVEDAKPRITAWSASRLKVYKQCPFKLKCSALDGLKEPETQPILDGHAIHKDAGSYLKGQLTEVPESLAHFKYTIEEMFQARAKAEWEAALDVSLEPADWFKGAWLRVIYDVLIDNEDGTLYIGDWKSGKPRHEDRDQLSLFAFSAFCLFPHVEEVYTELLYTKTGKTTKETYRRAQLPALKERWLKESAPMLADEEFLPVPNGLCGDCHFRKSNGGPCKFS
jgi:hypothetical protein